MRSYHFKQFQAVDRIGYAVQYSSTVQMFYNKIIVLVREPLG